VSPPPLPLPLPQLLLLLAMHVMTLNKDDDGADDGGWWRAEVSRLLVLLCGCSQSVGDESTCVQTTLISHSVPGLSVTDAAALQVKGKTHTRLPSVGFQS